MTKYELVDGILLNLGQNSQDRKFQPQQIAWTCDTVFGELMLEWTKAGYSKSDFAISSIVTVKKDTALNLKYIPLENALESVQSTNSLISVSKTQDRYNPFFMAKAGDIGIYSDLEAGNVSQPTYWIENNRMYFNNLEWFVSDVLVVAIPSINGMSDTDRLPLSNEQTAELVRRVSQLLLGGQIAEDKTNDGRQSIS